jgi:DNA-binding MarR family transcriptional regulator
MPHFNRSLNGLGRCGTLFRAKHLEGTEIGPCDHPYLFYICHHPGVSQDTLGRALYVNKSSVTRHLARLEEAGFLTRTPDPADRRSLLVSPTERAIALLPVLREVGGSWRELLTADFTEEETQLFEDLLQRAMKNAQNAIREETK